MRCFGLILVAAIVGCEIHPTGTVQGLQAKNATLTKQVGSLSSQVQKLNDVRKNRQRRGECVDAAERHYWHYVALNTTDLPVLVVTLGTDETYAAPSDESTTRILKEYRDQGTEVSVRRLQRGEEIPQMLYGPVWHARQNIWDDARADKLVRLKECEVRFMPVPGEQEQEQEQPDLSAAR